MGFIKQIAHSIHLTGFAFLFGNIMMDTIFGSRKLKAEQYPLLSKSYTISWISLIISGIIQIILFSKRYKSGKNKESKVEFNSKFGTWIRMLIIKALMTVFTAFILDIVVRVAVPEDKRRNVLKIGRIGLFCILFLISGYNREYREKELTKFYFDSNSINYNKSE